MAYPDRAVSIWFGKDRQKDSLYLQAWRQAPLTYSTRQVVTPGWNIDHYEVILGQDPTGELYQRAAQITLNNRFYPPDILTAVSDFSLEGRSVQVGDRVLQRIQVFQFRGKPVLEVLGMNEITEVIQEPRRAGFTYTTTATHSEVGEWSPVVEWRDNNEVVLVIDVVSTTRPGASRFSRRLTRKLQLRAHKRSIQNFKAQLAGVPLPAPKPRGVSVPADLAALGMLVTAFLLLVGWIVTTFTQDTE